MRRRSELLTLAGAHGLSVEYDPFLRFDPAACIHCWRCVRGCERLNGVAAIGVFGRGEAAHIGFGLDQPMVASTLQASTPARLTAAQAPEPRLDPLRRTAGTGTR